MAAREHAQGGVIARVRQHHPAVGHHRFGDHGRHFTACERDLQRLEVVELDRDGREGGVEGGTDGPLARHGPATAQAHHRLLDDAVIAAVEHQYFGPSGERTRPTQRRTVGVAGGLRQLPMRQTEARRERRP